MKLILSGETIAILKNMSTINPNIFIKKGNILRTISSTKSILARATVLDEFTNNLSIFDLSNFLAVISMFHNPVLDFSKNPERCVRIANNDTPSQFVEYVFADITNLTIPPEKDPNAGEILGEFLLKTDTLNKVLKAISILGVPEMGIIGKNGVLSIEAIDSKKNGSSRFCEEIGDFPMDFAAYVKAENLKMLTLNYKVKISTKGVVIFESTTENVNYSIYIALEQHSKI